MKCTQCQTDLQAKDYKGILINQCLSCEGLWLRKDEFRELKDKTDEFLCWLDFDLWEKSEHHTMKKTDKPCPVCAKPMYDVEYRDSHIVLPVCIPCKGVWLSKETQESLFSYLESVITGETVTGYLKEFGHEVISGKDSLKKELHDLKTILVLIEYRIFSRFPALERILTGFPK
ncbi:MAG: zf-TFIIB domain-containing protein [Candidatus Auribacterota bacterium]|nr:zf-TFIIB domain-containing protein [Candidatus Auribacterota bacterium]